jgi:hypothetical protein
VGIAFLSTPAQERSDTESKRIRSLSQSHAHKANNHPKGWVKSNKGAKYTDYIWKILQHHGARSLGNVWIMDLTKISVTLKEMQGIPLQRNFKRPLNEDFEEWVAG